ncbi:hypothetical protein GCM10022393_10460 [Aquimarina addita]|uniref:Fibronectin type-III domain-containing protein n=1 Tax=Aquimarina addita TaxID=870485 RepID=A0ABP7XD18_9FLAO
MKKHIIKTFIYIITTIFSIACSEDTIDLEGLGSIKGTVVSDGSNEPLPNVKIATNPPTSTVFTDDNGAYILNNVPVGDYSLSAQQEGLLAQFEAVSVLADKEIEIVFEMEVETAGNRPPEAAILLSPSDNAIDQLIDIDLIWTGSSDPDNDDLTYTINLRNDKNTTVEIFENIVDTTFTLNNLSYNVTYTWQVSSSDGINNAVNSTPFVFETVSPPNNRIIFARSVEGNSVLYSADEDGTTEIKLTSTAKNSFRPRRNTNTGKIAFLQSTGGQTHLFTMNQDGSEIAQVTSSVSVAGFNLEEIDFCWAENGAKLIFPNQDKLYSINTDGSGLSLLYQTTTGNLITEVDKNENSSTLILKTNDLNGYNVEIFTINTSGVVIETVLSGVSGAAGSINLSVDGGKLLYSYDVSGFENSTYRQLDTHLFVYSFSDSSRLDLSTEKPAGTNDLDARFSPNEAGVIFSNTSNDGISQKNIQTQSLTEPSTREIVIENASMADWE